jgi:RNA polymerase sigma-70 factor, ECF subfamily
MKASKQQIRWILLAQCGNLAAFDDLLQSVQRPLYVYVSRLTCDHFCAEDILQEIFVIIYKKLRWLRDPNLFFPWAYRIATREAFRWLKQERKKSHLAWEEEFADTIRDHRTSELQTHEMEEYLPFLLKKVSPASRAVLLLHYSKGLTLLEISELTGLALGTVKSRLAYGLNLLRQTESIGDSDTTQKK